MTLGRARISQTLQRNMSGTDSASLMGYNAGIRVV